MLGKFDRLCRIVRAGAGDDRHSPPRLGDADFDDMPMFRMGKRRAFACGPDRRQAMRAIGDLPVDKGAIGAFVEFGPP